MSLGRGEKSREDSLAESSDAKQNESLADCQVLRISKSQEIPQRKDESGETSRRNYLNVFVSLTVLDEISN